MTHAHSPNRCSGRARRHLALAGRHGMALGEVVVAVLIMSVCFVPILLVFANARTDTSRGVHRLRAMELINEAIDWIVICPVENLQKLAGFASGQISPIPAAEGLNRGIKPFIYAEKSGESYAVDYQNALHRDLLIRPTSEPSGLLQEAEVTVTWTESGKSYHYGMSVLVADEDHPDY